MFTGLVQATAEVLSLRLEKPGASLDLRWPWTEPPIIGESIAVNGCCLTVTAVSGGAARFDVGPVTLDRTNLGRLAEGDRVNLERSLRVGDSVGGHFVSGHVDGVCTVTAREPDGEWIVMEFDAPIELARHLVPKGSVAVDGVSLTVAFVDGRRFRVMLIPHTLGATTLGTRLEGSSCNLETDLLAKYVEGLVGVLIAPRP